jgi:hypothetical protein
MKTFRWAVILMSGFSALTLAACGEGYDMVKIRGTVPYVEERTAGPGVAFVRAHMMPEKTVVLPEPLIAPQMKDAEPIFEEKMQKK